MKYVCTGLLLVFLAPPAAWSGEGSGSSVRLAPQWQLAGLDSPESVALSADGSELYVSNVNGEGDALDGNGYISRVSTDGQMLEQHWVTGLNGPKGLVRDGERLYATDINQLVEISLPDGGIERRVAAPGAGFLNDVALLPDGKVVASDSATAKIYVLTSGQADVWLAHELLSSINGLLPEPQRLLVTTMAGRLLAIDYVSREITVLAEGLGDADGITGLRQGRYLVSEWPGLMHVVSADGSKKTIMDSREAGVFLNDFLRVGELLYQPHWQPGSITAYRLVQE